jgi:hypothetical protein
MEQLQQETAVSAPATIAVSSGQPEYRMLVLTRRLKLPGLLETMTDQAPEVARVMAKIEEDLGPAMDSLEGGPWAVNSHSVSIYNGLVIASFLLKR